jgi:hypothetical protein
MHLFLVSLQVYLLLIIIRPILLFIKYAVACTFIFLDLYACALSSLSLRKELGES